MSADEIQLPEAAWRRLDRWMRQRKPLHKASDGDKAASIVELLHLCRRTAMIGCSRRSSANTVPAACSWRWPARKTVFSPQHVIAA